MSMEKRGLLGCGRRMCSSECHSSFPFIDSIDILFSWLHEMLDKSVKCLSQTPNILSDPPEKSSESSELSIWNQRLFGILTDQCLISHQNSGCNTVIERHTGVFISLFSTSASFTTCLLSIPKLDMTGHIYIKRAVFRPEITGLPVFFVTVMCLCDNMP